MSKILLVLFISTLLAFKTIVGTYAQGTCEGSNQPTVTSIFDNFVTSLNVDFSIFINQTEEPRYFEEE